MDSVALGPGAAGTVPGKAIGVPDRLGDIDSEPGGHVKTACGAPPEPLPPEPVPPAPSPPEPAPPAPVSPPLEEPPVPGKAPPEPLPPELVPPELGAPPPAVAPPELGAPPLRPGNPERLARVSFMGCALTCEVWLNLERAFFPYWASWHLSSWRKIGTTSALSWTPAFRQRPLIFRVLFSPSI